MADVHYMYMDMVMIIKRFIHAEVAGLWEEHLAEVEKMLEYLVAAGHCICRCFFSNSKCRFNQF